MYIGGRSGGHGLDRGHDLGVVLDRAPAGRRGPEFGFTPSAVSRRRACLEHRFSQARTAWPKMIGSETFIIVAFMCSENSTPSALVFSISSARNASSARPT
jgi:hypothetical protein